MYWYKYFLISILIIFTSFAYAGKDQIVFSGKLYEYIDTHKITSDTTLTLAKTNKTIKPIVIKKYDVLVYTPNGEFYTQARSKNGTFKIELPRKSLFNIFIFAEGFETAVVQLNTENIDLYDEGPWQKLDMQFNLKLKGESNSLPYEFLLTEWNNNISAYKTMEIEVIDTTHTQLFRNLLKQDKPEAAAVCTKLIDKYFNGNTNKNKLKNEPEITRLAKNQYPIKIQMKRDMAGIKNIYDGLELKKQIIEVEMDVTDIKVAFTQDPEIDSILKLRRPQILSYIENLNTEFNKYKIEYDRLRSALNDFISANRAKKGDKLVAAIETFYTDSVPAHFESELLELLESFKTEGNDTFVFKAEDFFHAKKPKSYGVKTQAGKKQSSKQINSSNSLSNNNISNSNINSQNNWQATESIQYSSARAPSSIGFGEAFDEDGDYSDKVVDKNPTIVKNKTYESNLEKYIKQKYGEQAAKDLKWNTNTNYGSKNIDYANHSTRKESNNINTKIDNQSNNYQKALEALKENFGHLRVFPACRV